MPPSFFPRSPDVTVADERGGTHISLPTLVIHAGQTNRRSYVSFILRSCRLSFGFVSLPRRPLPRPPHRINHK